MFWQTELEPIPNSPTDWPTVTVVIPARNESEVIAATLKSLWEQDYPQPINIVLVDDQSTDGTADTALATAQECATLPHLHIVSAESLPPGWTGKVWAMHQGITRGLAHFDGPQTDTTSTSARFILFSDADIIHGRTAIRELVCRAEAASLDLASFMVRLRCESLPERLMIPAFVFFFKMLYPFRWSNDPSHRLAAAAGGTMLLRRSALNRLDDLRCIKSELIDDCALARAVKKGAHPIWIGLSATSESNRSYGTLPEIVHMVARTAYTQLGYSPIQLAGCILGLSLTFLAPVALTLSLNGLPALIGATIWLLMSLLYLPMIRFYRSSPIWIFTLPITATLYMIATLLSAIRHHRGRGGQWKGRNQS